MIKESEKPPFVRKVDYKDIDYRSDEESFHSTLGEVNDGEEVPTNHSMTYFATQEAEVVGVDGSGCISERHITQEAEELTEDQVAR